MIINSQQCTLIKFWQIINSKIQVSPLEILLNWNDCIWDGPVSHMYSLYCHFYITVHMGSLFNTQYIFGILLFLLYSAYRVALFTRCIHYTVICTFRAMSNQIICIQKLDVRKLSIFFQSMFRMIPDFLFVFVQKDYNNRALSPRPEALPERLR